MRVKVKNLVQFAHANAKSSFGRGTATKGTDKRHDVGFSDDIIVSSPALTKRNQGHPPSQPGRDEPLTQPTQQRTALNELPVINVKDDTNYVNETYENHENRTPDESMPNPVRRARKLSNHMVTRPSPNDLVLRGILKKDKGDGSVESLAEISRRLSVKLSERLQIDELIERRILFNESVTVARTYTASDYNRTAEKPWTKLTMGDKEAIKAELNQFKATEMEVHAASARYTRFHC
eukprot:CFRG4942T1